MILPTLKEEQILKELLTDYAEVKRDIRKTVKKRQRSAQKRGTWFQAGRHSLECSDGTSILQQVDVSKGDY